MRVIMPAKMMRRLLLTTLAAAALMLIGVGVVRAQDKPPVVVELFTSQGCSSCPPADNFLGDLSKRSDVLALSFHVDYWDYIGWKDPYAFHLATERQRAYSHNFSLSYIYTPQMVVNGVLQGVGSDRFDIDALITKASARPVARPSFTLERLRDGGIVVHVGAGDAKKPATVWLACFDRQQTTKVLRGENGGTTLTNYHVVRDFESLGLWKGSAVDLPVPPAEVADFENEPNRGMAVLLQVDGSGQILAAQTLADRR